MIFTPNVKMANSCTAVLFLLVSIFAVACSHNDHHNRYEEKWISFIKELGFLSENFTSTVASINVENTPAHQDIYFTEEQPSTEATIPEVMHGYEYDPPKNRGLVVGLPIGGIILLFLLCYCCYKCCCGCCRDDITVKNTTIVQSAPPQQQVAPTQVVVQHFQPAPQMPYPVQGFTQVPNQGWNQYPQQQPPPNQQFQQHAPPPPVYSQYEMQSPGQGNPTAPPQYEKY